MQGGSQLLSKGETGICLLVGTFMIGFAGWLLYEYFTFVPSRPEEFVWLGGVIESTEDFGGGKSPYRDIRLEGDDILYRVAKPSYQYFKKLAFRRDVSPGQHIELRIRKGAPKTPPFSDEIISFVYSVRSGAQLYLTLDSYLQWEHSNRRYTFLLVGFLLVCGVFCFWCIMPRLADPQAKQNPIEAKTPNT